MKLWSARPLAVLASLATLVAPSFARDRVLQSNSLAACQENSGFTASLFDVVFFPDNGTVNINMLATSSIQGYVVFDIRILAYGYQIMHEVLDPCNLGDESLSLAGLCPMNAGKMSNPFKLDLGPDVKDKIPGIAYTFPDLDATVKVFVNMTGGEMAGETVACLEANVSNGMTVDLIGVKWATWAVVFLGIMSSALLSGLGYANAASHVASSTLSLYGYFQAQAMIGLCGVHLPPAVRSWTQDFVWSMGIIRVQFIQDILTWYQRATGGTASTVLNSLETVSVQVEKVKRALPAEYVDPAINLFKRATAMLPRAAAQVGGRIAKRANIQTSFGSYIVYGIQRVAFRGNIESTNLFMTSLTFFYIFVVFTAILVILFKLGLELFAKMGWVKGDAFSEFRAGWITVLKGILYRVGLVGFPQVTVMCMWEFTQKDSPAEVALAVFFFFGLLATLLWAAWKVIRIARRSIALHRNPAYILFSDPQALNKWGFLYVQFRASGYYFILPILFYIVIKGMFIAFAQAHGTLQAIALLIIEAAALITATVMRPWMDKSTNTFNIVICAMNFLNAILLFLLTDVFDFPPLVIGVVGLVLWIANAIVCLILLLMLIITTAITLFHNNPDTRYQFMNDDRTSFMKSNPKLHTQSELEALGVTARGESKLYTKSPLSFEDDDSAVSSPSNPLNRPGTADSNTGNPYFHSNRHSGRWSNDPSLMKDEPFVRHRPSGSIQTPSPMTDSASSLPRRQASPHSVISEKKPHTTNASPWQRGAGYE
ncbi:hypothetical protein SMACR_09013 [Sordaria macrospora]|uniref:WGS project CABT00000000 data, contig 2.31 n=2 Tax=Sordaria macrospora TaxID=5147 RepID=F7W5N0_SORMK|nr:uncharacterized protein SMAC_09013 [Sordaria macrospora k-hell]KAA8635494.1 hypothetical protein SMACR_09013 [Sordaria macrospora]KAH7629550.1 hypothetical protein B0T09DRAFT_266559 [Sordaria sp. MPI-SDFR-AT-0083]WPJ66236.1 hypothetical protein SMAC4_09013 [Sordaria macrospora]CCC12818.1 unnamed protein product [Sordaria macrospora k-hell]